MWGQGVGQLQTHSMHTHTRTNIQPHICTHTNTYTYTWLHIHIHISTQEYMCIHIHIHIHASKYIPHAFHHTSQVHIKTFIHTSQHAIQHTKTHITTSIRTHNIRHCPVFSWQCYQEKPGQVINIRRVARVDVLLYGENPPLLDAWTRTNTCMFDCRDAHYTTQNQWRAV